MMQIKIRWRDLGSPTQPGEYRYGLDMVRVTVGDIELAKGNPDAVFTPIHPISIQANLYPHPRRVSCRLIAEVARGGRVQGRPARQRMAIRPCVFLQDTALGAEKTRA
jgi:hypothetical protein